MNFGSIGFGLLAAALWGSGDFSGGVASKSRDAFRVVAGAHGTGLILSLAIALLIREPLPSTAAVLWAILGGVSGGLALGAFYRALAIGTMGVNAPAAAIITTALPLAVGMFTQGIPKPLQLAGFALAALSILLVSRPEKLHGRPKGLGLAILSGVGFGIFLVALQRAGTEHIFWPLTVARLASAAVAVAMVLITRPAKSDSSIALVALAGTFDTLGNACFMLAARSGRLDIAAMLSSLYPVTTVLLAYFVMRERIHRVQAIGSVLALLAVLMISS